MNEFRTPVLAETVRMPLSRQDEDHLRLLKIFHFIYAGLLALGMLFLAGHYTIFSLVMTNPAVFKNNKNPPPPELFEMFGLFKWFYLAMGLVLLVGVVLNALSGWFIGQRRHRFVTLGIAGLDCLQAPIGTALGVCTIMVLCRESVRDAYEGTSGTTHAS